MTRTNKRFQANHSILTSAVVHFSVLGTLALCGVSQQLTQARSLRMSWGNSQEELQSIEVLGFDLESDKEQEKVVELALPAQEMQLPELAIEQAAVDASDDYSVLFQPLSDTPLRKDSGSGRDRGRHSRRHQGSDRGQGRAGGGQAVTFFGAGAPAQKIVFVLDNSGSMNRPMFAQSRERVLKTEVMRSIRSLEEEMLFDVIFFSDKVLELDSRGLRPATAENKREQHSDLHDLPGRPRRCGGSDSARFTKRRNVQVHSVALSPPMFSRDSPHLVSLPGRRLPIARMQKTRTLAHAVKRAEHGPQRGVTTISPSRQRA